MESGFRRQEVRFLSFRKRSFRVMGNRPFWKRDSLQGKASSPDPLFRGFTEVVPDGLRSGLLRREGEGEDGIFILLIRTWTWVMIKSSGGDGGAQREYSPRL